MEMWQNMAKHVLARLSYTTQGNHVSAVLDDLRVVEGNRPNSANDIDGCYSEVLEDLARRQPSLTSTRTRLGVGTALVVNDITKLTWGSERVVRNLRTKVPALFDHEGMLIARQGLIGLFRDGGAGSTTHCTDVCSGILETTDILAGAYCEGVEAGFYFLGKQYKQYSVGLGRFVVPTSAGGAQEDVDTAAAAEWCRLGNDDHLSRDIFSSTVTSHHIDNVMIDGTQHRCILSAEPWIGSVEIVFPTLLDLPTVEGGWRVRDTEHMETKRGPVALNRRPTLIVPLGEGKPPVLLGLGPDGLDLHAPIIYLEGSNLEMTINGKVLSVLKALGWL